MKRNMGTVDRVLRTTVAAPALVLLGLVVLEVGSLLSVAALVLAGVMLSTSAIGFCPAYAPLGISTLSRSEASSGPTRIVTQH